MDFYSPLPSPFHFSPSFSVFLRLFLFFGNHIETPYVPLSQAPDVCNGNSRHRGKKLSRPDGRRGRGSVGGKKGGTRRGMGWTRGAGGGGGNSHRSRVCLPIFPPGAMWIFVITEPKRPPQFLFAIRTTIFNFE